MRGILGFLIRRSGLLLFVLLEAVSFYLIIRFNETQRLIGLTSANKFTGYLYKQYDAVADYLTLGQQMEKLQAENARLHEQQLIWQIIREDSLTMNTPPTAALEGADSSQFTSTLRDSFQFIPVRIINNSIAAENNILTINRGRKDGVEPRMGLMGVDGIIGIVRDVSDHYATVMSLLHRQTRISATVGEAGFFGALRWEDRDPRYMWLTDVPKHADIKTGDLVRTSGHSFIFPVGILIGKVEKAFIPEGDNFYRIRVRLNNDLSRQQFGYVIRHSRGAELSSLEQRIAQ